MTTGPTPIDALPSAPADPPIARARLFDADRSDREVALSPATVEAIGDRQLLWVDARHGARAQLPAEVLDALSLDAAAVDAVWRSSPVPRLSIHGDYFLVRVVLLRDADGELERLTLDIAVGKNFVLTAHEASIEFLGDLDERIRGDTSLGEIDAADFATVLLDGLVTSYLELTDSILREVDKLDGQALKGSGTRDLLADLVALRHRISTVRRVLVAHRPVMASMAGADFQVINGPEAGPQFASLTERFDGAIVAIDAAREALLGTFDIHMSRTAQRTNDTIKILTIVSVLLLPTGVIAGFMGMNIRAPYSNDDPAIFWVVVVGIVVVAAFTLIALRLRRWL